MQLTLNEAVPDTAIQSLKVFYSSAEPHESEYSRSMPNTPARAKPRTIPHPLKKLATLDAKPYTNGWLPFFSSDVRRERNSGGCMKKILAKFKRLFLKNCKGEGSLTVRHVGQSLLGGVRSLLNCQGILEPFVYWGWC